MIVNGETRNVPDGITLEKLMHELSMPFQRVAVELNKSVVPRADWAATTVKASDRLEIVHFVGGG